VDNRPIRVAGQGRGAAACRLPLTPPTETPPDRRRKFTVIEGGKS
jgi:hypothetical protein